MEVIGSVYVCLQQYLLNSMRSATPDHHLTNMSKSLTVCVLVLIRAVSRGDVCVCVCVILMHACLCAVLRVTGLKITLKSHS